MLIEFFEIQNHTIWRIFLFPKKNIRDKFSGLMSTIFNDAFSQQFYNFLVKNFLFTLIHRNLSLRTILCGGNFPFQIQYGGVWWYPSDVKSYQFSAKCFNRPAICVSQSGLTNDTLLQIPMFCSSGWSLCVPTWDMFLGMNGLKKCLLPRPLLLW